MEGGEQDNENANQVPDFGEQERENQRGTGTGFVKLAENEFYFPVPQRRQSSRSELSESSSDVSRGLESVSPVFTPINDFNTSEGEDGDTEERLASFKDSELISGKEEDGEWEETLLYIDLDDIPSVNELFAVEPDDFLTFQSRTQRELPKARKETVPELRMRMYNLESSAPILQIGTRYYVGKYEEPSGSALIFQKKVPTTNSESNRLPSVVPEPVPPKDKVFHEKLRSSKHSEYELVANVSKILKMSRKEVQLAGVGADAHKLPATPGGLPLQAPSLPYGYNSAKSLFINKPTDEEGNNVVSEALRKPGPVGPRNRAQKSTSSSESPIEAIEAADADSMEVDDITIQQSPSCLEDQDSNNSALNEEFLAPEQITFGMKNE